MKIFFHRLGLYSVHFVIETLWFDWRLQYEQRDFLRDLRVHDFVVSGNPESGMLKGLFYIKNFCASVQKAYGYG
jgi:hypothetical protein